MLRLFVATTLNFGFCIMASHKSAIAVTRDSYGTTASYNMVKLSLSKRKKDPTQYFLTVEQSRARLPSSSPSRVFEVAWMMEAPEAGVQITFRSLRSRSATNYSTIVARMKSKTEDSGSSHLSRTARCPTEKLFSRDLPVIEFSP